MKTNKTIIVKIATDPEDQSKCGDPFSPNPCPLIKDTDALDSMCSITGEYLMGVERLSRCQACLDGEKQYNSLSNDLTERFLQIGQEMIKNGETGVHCKTCRRHYPQCWVYDNACIFCKGEVSPPK